MTIRYIYSASAQDDSDAEFNSSTISYLTYQLALAAWVIGDVIYQAHDHAENSAVTLTLTCSAATQIDRVPIYRVNRITGAYSPTTGSDAIAIDVTGAGNDLEFNFACVLHGMHFRSIDRINHLSSYKAVYFIGCYIECGAYWSTGTAGRANVQSRNCTLKYNASNGNHYNEGVGLVHEGLTVIGDLTTNGWLKTTGVDTGLQSKLIGCDFTGITSPSTEPLVDAARANAGRIDVDFIACFFDSGRVIVTLSQLDSPFHRIRVHNSKDDGSTYISQLYMMTGTVDTDTSVYYTGTDAAQDADSDTPVSREMTPTSACEVHEPLVSIDMLARVDSTGSKTFTVELVENFTAALTQQECWLEVFSLNGALSTLWSLDYGNREFIESSYTNLAAGSGLTDWTGEPASSRSEKVTVTATINQAGMFLVRLHLGKYESGKECFYNPVVTVS